jgi:hypothetical protein
LSLDSDRILEIYVDQGVRDFGLAPRSEVQCDPSDQKHAIRYASTTVTGKGMKLPRSS